MMRKIFPVLIAMSLAACGSAPRTSESMTAALAMSSLEAQGQTSTEYRIGAQDVLAVSVFRVPEMSLESVRVDSAGMIQMPLIGSVPAAPRTTAELASDIRTRLGTSYLRDPQVTVRVIEAASQKVTIDGAVNEPGVYEMKGRTTLIQAVAMAKGPSAVSDLRSVAVFRTVNDQRMVAVFDLRAIRMGQAEDPVLAGDDIVVVDTSRLSVLTREIINALPGLSIFRAY
jgi:polysaccharide biosynthesis/export protein